MFHYMPRRKIRQNGFTLVELMIAMGILLILTTLSVAVYTTTSSADRIRSSARQVQSSFGGARDREIKAVRTNPGARRGLRLLVDAGDPTTVTSMVYVGFDANWTDGQIVIGRADLNNDGAADADVVRTLRGWPKYDPITGIITVTGWLNLYNQGLLTDGCRIRIPANTGTWYTVSTALLQSYSGSGPEILLLTTDYRNTPPVTNYGTVSSPGVDGQPGTNGGLNQIPGGDDDQDGTANNAIETGAPGSDDETDLNMLSGPLSASQNPGVDYELELKPSVLPGQEPLRLSSGIAIDLYHSQIPSSWYQQRSLATGSALPPVDQGWDQASGSYYYNGWGVWSIEGPDSSIAGNDIYRQYSPRMDIMFSPQGSVIGGALTTVGLLHLRLADVQDIGESRDPANPQAAPMLYSTLFPQTGFVATFPVNTTDSNSDGYADDPLYFARIGGIAGR